MMFTQGIRLATLLVAAILSTHGIVSVQAHEHEDGRCGTKSAPPDIAAFEQAREALLKSTLSPGGRRRAYTGPPCDELCKQCIEIETYFHFIAVESDPPFLPHPSKTFEEYWNATLNSTAMNVSASDYNFTSVDDMLLLVDDQMKDLNDRFVDTPFRFQHVNRDDPSVHANTSWALDISYFDDENDIYYDWEASATLGQGDLTTLNVFLAYGVGGEEPNPILGFAWIPAFQWLKEGDGVFLRYDTLLNGGREDADGGVTLTHECGHWLGLEHPFTNLLNLTGEGGDACDPANGQDWVEDTPAMAIPTSRVNATVTPDGEVLFGYDCLDLMGPDAPVIDTCPDREGTDPIFNFMNYLEKDECYPATDGFTCGQIERMYYHWLLYREEVDVCPGGEMEVGFFITFDEEGVLEPHNDFFLFDANSDDTIYNSTREYEHSDPIVSVDLCVPEGEYSLVVRDSLGNGFGAPYNPDETPHIEAFLGGVSVGRVEGDFGSEAVLRIAKAEDNNTRDNSTSSACATPMNWFSALKIGLFPLLIINV